MAHMVLSHARAMLGQWDLAAEDFARANEQAPQEKKAAQLLAMQGCCLLAKGDKEGYRRACRSLVDRSGKAKYLDSVYLAARAGVLSPDSGIDPAVAIRLAERSLQDGPVAWRLQALGLAHYRARQYEAALKRLREVEATRWAGNPTTALVQAMVYHDLGKADEAQRRLSIATRNPLPYIHPHEAVVYHILRREAEELLKSPSGGKHP
jgi:tetratricopeptide (TPR) repeat protein